MLNVCSKLVVQLASSNQRRVDGLLRDLFMVVAPRVDLIKKSITLIQD